MADQRLAGRLGVAGSVILSGPVPWPELPSYYDAGDVFAMPCRTRRHGLDVEGLGIVYLEASATGLPVVGGDSGNVVAVRPLRHGTMTEFDITQRMLEVVLRKAGVTRLPRPRVRRRATSRR